MRLNFCRTKLSHIADLLNICVLYFRGFWVDPLVAGKLCNYATISDEASSVYIVSLSNIKVAKWGNGHCW